MKRINLCALLLVVMLIPEVVKAECPGYSTAFTFLTGKGIAISGNSSLGAFIGTGCITGMFGSNPPTNCAVTISTLGVIFASAGHNTVANGCIFTCNGGANVCQLRGGDGLPVELMEFSVGE